MTLRLLLLAALTLPARAEPPPLRIGVIEDMSTAMAAVYGDGAVAAARMAVEDGGQPSSDAPSNC